MGLIWLAILIGIFSLFGRFLIETTFFRTGYVLLVITIPLLILGLILMLLMTFNII